MGVDHVLQVHPPVQELVRLDVRVRVTRPHVIGVVALGEEPRRAQHHHRQSAVAVQQLADVLGGGLGHAVDVARDRRGVLGDPRRGRAGRGDQGPAEGAGRAGADEAGHPGRGGLLGQHQRAGDVGVDERLAVVGADMRLVQRRGVQHGADPAQAPPDQGAVGDRAGHRRVRGGPQVQAGDRPPGRPRRGDQRLAQMPGAAGDQDHLRAHPPAVAGSSRA